MSTTEVPAEQETQSPRLVIDGPREPRVAPFRHRHSPRVRRRARELGADLDRIHGSGPGGRVRQEDVERAADEIGSTPGTSLPRLAVDGPVRARVGPYRHTHSPRVRRLAAELGVDPAQVEGSGPSGRVRPIDVEEAASTPVSASSAPRGEDAPPTSSTRSARRSSDPDVAAVGGSTRTVQLDLGPTVAAWRRLTAGQRPEGVEATPFLLVAHALLAELPAVAAAASSTAAADPLVVDLDPPGLDGPRSVVDGHHLTILGLLRRLALAPADAPDAPAPLVVVGERDGSGGPPTDGPLLDVRLGPLKDRPAASQDEFGHQVTTIRPTVEMTVHHDPDRVPDTAVDRLVAALGRRLAHVHRTIGV